MKLHKILNNPLFISLSGNLLMVIARMWYAESLYYGFLLWNLFLAGVPLMISQALHRRKYARVILYPAICLWILFLPNAPYIITDLVHLYHRPPVPYWYDMLLVMLSVVNGLVLGFISISQVEEIMLRRDAQRLIIPFRITVMLAMSYGVYLGRYLRFNSWDAILNPMMVLQGVSDTLEKSTFAYVITFSFVSYVMYSFYRAILQRHSPEVL